MKNILYPVPAAETADIAGLRSRAFGRRGVFKAIAAGSAVVALAGCNGMTAQAVAGDVITMFQAASQAITSFLSQMGIAVPASVVAFIAKIQAVAAQVVAGINTLAASGFVQEAYGYFQSIVALVSTAFGGTLPGIVASAVGVVMQAFSWLMSALGVAKPAALARANAPSDPNVIINNLHVIIARAGI